ncbi:helix-turn-helix domain-containing protein [Paenibacillus qinlingensis]|uniref:helix-turn-helix domain-containing protein n=1 Tax=Paenibacillus qinlingensis TaxID=1837343 RepID=UPI0015673F14|nr:helix-turn-helix domain-containing protein [Paenibacillus qinlingensis]NQX60773.1 helix-turn-helix domain-containing protein [Paenibacillus qinlingensis]
MHKKWFYRLLFSYFPIFFILTSILILLTFLLLTGLTKRETVNVNQQFTRHVIQLIDHSLKEIDQALIKDIESDTKLKAFFENDPSLSYFNHYEISRKVRDMISTNGFIDSIYIFRNMDQMIMSKNTFISLDKFGDRDFVSQRLKLASLYELSGKRDYMEFQDTEHFPTPVVSLVRKYPLLVGGQGLIVVNISLASIEQMVKGLTSSNVNFVRIKDFNENVLLGEKQGELPGTILSEITSEYTGWTFTGGVHDERIFRYASVFSYIWVAVGLLIVIAGTIWMAFVTRKNYKPIEEILNQINRYSVQKSGKLSKHVPDEFKFIEQALDNLIEESNTFQKMHEEDAIFRRRHFFVELLEGSRPIEPTEWDEELERLNLPAQFLSLGVIVLEIDKFTTMVDVYNHRDLFLLKFVVNSVVKEMAESHPLTVWTEWTAQHRLTVLYQSEEQASELEIRLIDLSEGIRGWVESNLDFTLTIGVGPSVAHIEDIAKSYAGATVALSYKPSLGLNRVISYQVPGGVQDGAFWHLQTIQIFARAFRTGEEPWRQILANMFQEARENRLSRSELVQFLNSLSHHVYREIMEFPAEIQVVWKSDVLPRINQICESFDLTEDLEAQVGQLLEEFELRVRELQERSSHYALIRDVKAYIEKEYANAEMSLNHLYDVFGLNGKYVSRLFKEAFGEKLVDYLVRIRIENSQRLLVTSSLSLQEIANAVGYIHDISYIRAFKKVVGTTPGEYRKNHGKSPS